MAKRKAAEAATEPGAAGTCPDCGRSRYECDRTEPLYRGEFCRGRIRRATEVARFYMVTGTLESA